jgi:ADP-ribose pyrophosphatase YjhB (NUDIX family)
MRDSKNRSGHAVVRSHNKFLLLRKNYGNPNFWHCPGGMAKHNEHRLNAAVRETYEETGCKVVPLKQLRKSDFANYYFCKKIGGHAFAKSHEILQVRWFSIDEIKDLHKKGLLTNCNIGWFEID